MILPTRNFVKVAFVVLALLFFGRLGFAVGEVCTYDSDCQQPQEFCCWQMQGGLYQGACEMLGTPCGDVAQNGSAGGSMQIVPTYVADAPGMLGTCYFALNCTGPTVNGVPTTREMCLTYEGYSWSDGAQCFNR